MHARDCFYVGKHATQSARQIASPLGSFYGKTLNWQQWLRNDFERTGYPLVIIGGIFTFGSVFLHPLLHHFLAQGYNAYAIAPKSFSHYSVNLEYLEERLKLIERQDRSFRESDKIILVGNSMGGVLGFMLSMGSKEWSCRIAKIAAMATPFFRGIARPALRSFVLRYTGISEELWHYHDRDGTATAHADRKLINIASTCDTTAPYEHCHIPTSTCSQIDVFTRIEDESQRRVDHLQFITNPHVHALLEESIKQEVP